MGGALMLMAMAVSAITYGWTPDGGDGVVFIIQVPPEKLDQLARTGEVASQIPNEIRGHVSQVIVRVGNERLPRVTPRHVASVALRHPSADLARSTTPLGAGSATTGRSDLAFAIEDDLPMPIPSMNRSDALTPIRGNAGPTAMMKPAPQGGGMNFPGSFGAPSTSTPSSVGNGIQNTARNAANQLRTGVQQATQAAQATGQTLRDRAASTAADLIAGGNRASDPRNSSVNPDDPRFRLAQPRATQSDNRSNVNGPSTNPIDTRASAQPRTPFGPSLPPEMQARSGQAATSSASGTRDAEQWYDLRNKSRQRPSTDPLDSSSIASGDFRANQNTNSQNASSQNRGAGQGGFATNNFNRDDARNSSGATGQSGRGNASGLGGNFASFPSGMQRDDDLGNRTSAQADTRYANNSNANDLRSSRNDSIPDYDPRLTPEEAQQLPENGYSFDTDGYAIDRQGYRLNRYGRRIETNNQTAVASIGTPQQPDTRYQDPNRPTYGNGTSSYASPTGNQAVGGPQNQLPSTNQPGYQNQPSYAGQQGQPNYVGQPSYAGQPNYVGQAGYQNQPGYGTQQPSYQNGVAAPGPYTPVSNPAVPNLAAQTGYGQPNAFGQPTLNPGYAGPQLPPNYQAPTVAAVSGVSNPGGNSSNRLNPDDHLDKAGSSSSSGSLRAADEVAAQPLFNGLLLASVVVNIYLLFWLKNLRLQFRDMVASKRSTSGGAVLAAGVS